MAIALVGSGSAFAPGAADGFTSGSFDTSGSDLIVISFGQGNDVTSGVISADSKSNTWNSLTQQAGNRSNRLYYAFNATVGTGHTFTCTGTDNFPTMSIAWFSGALTATDPFDQQNGAVDAAGTSFQPGSVTPSTNSQLVITGVCTSSTGASHTITSPFTKIAEITNTDFGHEGNALGYEIQTTATARNPTWTHDQNAAWATAIATFKALVDVAIAPSPVAIPLVLPEPVFPVDAQMWTTRTIWQPRQIRVR